VDRKKKKSTGKTWQKRGTFNVVEPEKGKKVFRKDSRRKKLADGLNVSAAQKFNQKMAQLFKKIASGGGGTTRQPRSQIGPCLPGKIENQSRLWTRWILSLTGKKKRCRDW